MLSHMLFNRLKWWNVDDNAESIQIGNRQFWAIPSKIIIKDGADLRRYDDDNRTTLVDRDTTVKVIGAYKNAYIITGYVHFRSTNLYSITFDEKRPGIIYANEVKKVIWGGKRLLSHLYQALRRVVIA